MEIISRGKIPDEKRRFTCDRCLTVFIAMKSETECSSQMEVVHDGLPGRKVKCPVCGNVIYF